jgi:RNA polymerase sigma-70 factor (ECF subfamily)
MIFGAVMEWERPMAVEDEAVKLRRRDPETLVALVGRYQHRLYRYLLRLVHDSAAAEDLFQQTWLRVVQNIRRYDPRRSFEAWLFSVAHNLAIDHLRRRQPESLDEPAASREEVAAADPDALQRLLARERAGLLEAAVAELPAVYREALTLRFEEDMKLEEMAEVIHAPLSTVKSRLRRALEGLRWKLETELGGGK